MRLPSMSSMNVLSGRKPRDAPEPDEMSTAPATTASTASHSTAPSRSPRKKNAISAVKMG